MAKKKKDMSWLLDDEDTTSVDILDCNGNLLNDGDNVIATKDLKVK